MLFLCFLNHEKEWENFVQMDVFFENIKCVFVNIDRKYKFFVKI